MNLPDPPTNVRILIGDHEHHVEVVYNGLDEHGQHWWKATTTCRGLPTAILADRLPANTSISVEFDPLG